MEGDGGGRGKRRQIYVPKTRSFPRFFDIRRFLPLPANSRLRRSNSAPAAKLSISKNRSTLYRFRGIYLPPLSAVYWQNWIKVVVSF